MRTPTSILRRGAAAAARTLGATAQWRNLRLSVEGTRESSTDTKEEVRHLRKQVGELQGLVAAIDDRLAASLERQSDLRRAVEEQLELARAGGDRGEQILQRTAALDERVATRVATHQLAPALTRAVRAMDVDAWALLALRDLIPSATRLPPPGGAAGWAATPETVLLLVREVLRRPDHPAVVECGSGASTVWLSAALAERGGGQLVALEHSEEYAEATRRALRAAGLERLATVVAAPLAPTDLPEHDTPWYDDDLVLHLPSHVDVLFVDGPPGATGPAARLPALPLLRDRLSTGAAVVLDDTDRTEERQVVTTWLDGADQRLTVEQRTDRATLMRWHPDGGGVTTDDQA